MGTAVNIQAMHMIIRAFIKEQVILSDIAGTGND
jgi:hypothetical protein